MIMKPDGVKHRDPDMPRDIAASLPFKARMLARCLILAWLCLCGCTESDSASAHARFAPVAPVTISASDVPDRKTMHEGTVRIVPAFPTGTTDLRTVCTGFAEVNYEWERNGIRMAGETGPVLSKNRFRKGDRIRVKITARETEAADSVMIGNSLPEITSVSVNQFLYRGADIRVLPLAVDADGDPVWFRYAWSVNGEPSPENMPALRGDTFNRDDIVSITIIPCDGEDEGAPFTLDSLVIRNAPPRIVSLPPIDVKSNTYVYYVKADDADHDALTFTLNNAPPGMVINDKTGEIVWEMTSADEGIHVVEIAVKDTQGAQTVQKYSLRLTHINTAAAR